MKKLLFLFSIASLMAFFFLSVSVSSCNNKPEIDTTVKKQPCPEVATALIGTNFYELELSKNDYETQLKPFHGGDGKKIVFQFYFKTSWPNSPSLIAYSSKSKNAYKKGGATRSAILSITTTKGRAVPAEFVLGDQQIEFNEIDGYITGAGSPADYTLVFKPKMDGLNVCYDVCVKYMQGGVEKVYCPPNAGSGTQPSPPADAK
jgi:hypothetical protein